MKFLSKTALLLLIFSIIPLNAQNYEARQKKLEAQKISLTKQINQINSLISDSRKKSKNLANVQRWVTSRAQPIHEASTEQLSATGFQLFHQLMQQSCLVLVRCIATTDPAKSWSQLWVVRRRDADLDLVFCHSNSLALAGIKGITDFAAKPELACCGWSTESVPCRS